MDEAGYTPGPCHHWKLARRPTDTSCQHGSSLPAWNASKSVLVTLSRPVMRVHSSGGCCSPRAEAGAGAHTSLTVSPGDGGAIPAVTIKLCSFSDWLKEATWPSLGGSVGWSITCTPKGWAFDSQSGHMPRLRVQSLAGAHRGGNQSVFLSLPLSLKSIKPYFLKIIFF